MTSEAAQYPERDSSLERLLFFSDGVFAIAITLLSIELHPPHGWDGSAGMLMREGWPMLASFALSFAVIGIFWNAHRRLFQGMVRFSNAVFVLNLLLLAGVALMPFVTTLLYAPTMGGDTIALYLGLVSLIGLVQGLTYGYAAFVADVMHPRRPVPARLSAMLIQGLIPGASCGMSFAIFGRAPFSVILGLAAVLAGVVGFRVWTGRRYGA